MRHFRMAGLSEINPGMPEWKLAKPAIAALLAAFRFFQPCFERPRAQPVAMRLG